MLERLFRLRAHGTSIRTEILGGVTTFVTMAYIIVVNPAILQAAGLPVAPYMGENAFIAFGLASPGRAAGGRGS